MEPWTEEDAFHFAQFIAEREGRVTSGEITSNGGWAGLIECPSGSSPGWAKDRLNEFEKIRTQTRVPQRVEAMATG